MGYSSRNLEVQAEGLGALPLNLDAEGSGVPQLDSGTLAIGSRPVSPIHFNNAATPREERWIHPHLNTCLILFGGKHQAACLQRDLLMLSSVTKFWYNYF
jgi:hypothetical protein